MKPKSTQEILGAHVLVGTKRPAGGSLAENGGDCWIWVGSKNKKGYGMLTKAGATTRSAHRFFYQQLVGPIPEKMEIDHRCENRDCVNPTHLEAVTHAENIRRGRRNNSNLKKTKCPNGHRYNYFWTDGSRKCLVCINKMSRERARRIKDKR